MHWKRLVGWVVFVLSVATMVVAAVFASTELLSGAAAAVMAGGAALAGISVEVIIGLFTARGKSRPRSRSNTLLDSLVLDPARLRTDLEAVLEDASRKIAFETRLDEGRIGLHCWVIHWSRGSGFRLVRIARYRAPPRPPTERPPYPRGQGLVGWCWMRGKWTYEDLRPLRGLTPEQYEELEDEGRKGRDYPDLLKSIDTYSLIAATPMFELKLPPIRGVVSLNFDHNITLPVEVLVSGPIRSAAEIAADGCSRLLSQAGVFDRLKSHSADHS